MYIYMITVYGHPQQAWKKVHHQQICRDVYYSTYLWGMIAGKCIA